MMYERKTFTVPASSTKAPADCKHRWRDARGKCVLCGEHVESRIGHESFCRAPEGGACGCKTVILPAFR